MIGALNPYAIALLILFPMALIAFNEAAQRTALPRPRLSQVIRMTRDTVLPFVAATLFVRVVLIQPDPILDEAGNVTNAPGTSFLYRFLFTIAAIATLNAGIALLNLAFSSSERQRIPNLLLDLIRIVAVLAGTAVIIANVWDQDLGELITALGVGSLVIGLALQPTLSNLFSGLSLLSEQTIKVGDWVRIGETEGQVTRVAWRSLSLRTYEGTVIVVSNTGLAENQIEKLTREDGLTELQIMVQVIPNVPPERIRDAFLEAGQATPHTNGSPAVTFENYTDRGLNVEMALLLEDFTYRDAAMDAFNSLIWYSCQRHGVTLNAQTMRHYDIRPPETIIGQTVADRANLLTKSGALPVSDDLIQAVARVGAYQEWRGGESLSDIGRISSGVIFVLSGRLAIESDDNGLTTEIDIIRSGQAYVTSRSLRSDVSLVRVRALRDVSVIALAAPDAERLMTQHPELARIIDDMIDTYDADLSEAGQNRREARRTVRLAAQRRTSATD